MRALPSALSLTAVYALTLASADPLDLLTGAVIAAALLFWLRRFLSGGGKPAHPSAVARRSLAFPPLMLAVLLDVVRGTWQVALVVTGRRPLRRPGIVSVPMDDRSPAGVVASSLMLTLAPGEFLVDLDWEGRVMLVHVLDASDPEDARHRHAVFYERYQRAVFP